ncbi:MAG: replication initiator protein A [Symbiobacteriaceae bacterium]|nr:replication initiator protein A [Symbiobacteriaceae bacterium]
MSYFALVPVAGQFDQVPSVLFSSDYIDLSMAAKLLYTRMLSLTSCSAYHDYQDQKGVYITLSRSGIMRYLDCAQQKATMVIKELVKHNLITLESEGVNRGRIYLRAAKGMLADSSADYFHTPHKPQFFFWKLPRKLPANLSEGARILYAYLSDVIRTTKAGGISLIKSVLAKILHADRRVVGKWVNELSAANLIVKDSSPVTPKSILSTATQKSTPASMLSSSRGARDEKAVTRFSEENEERVSRVVRLETLVDTKLRVGIPVRPEMYHQRQDDLCSPNIISTEEIKERIDYDFQLQHSPAFANLVLDSSVSVLEKLLQGKENVKVGDKIHPGDEVRKILMNFTKRHMTAVLDSFKRYSGLIRNPDTWLKVVMINTVLEHPDINSPAQSSPRNLISNNLRRSGFSVGSLGARQETHEERKARFDRLLE